MQAILAKLNKTNGVRGSMVVNKDGIVVASDFAEEVSENSIGAVSSSVLSAIEGALTRTNMGAFQRFIINGSENTIAIINSGPTLLVVLLQRELNMGMVNVEIKQAADAIRENSKI